VAPLVLPFPGPVGPVNRDALLDGWPAALVAVLRQDTERAQRLLAPHARLRRADGRLTSSVRDAGTLLIRALLMKGAVAEAEELLRSLHAAAAAEDNADALCQLAVIATRAQLAVGRALDAEANVEEHLWLAATLGLGVRWIDLMVARSDVLRALGKIDDARRCAEVALHGLPGEGLRGALHGRSRYHVGALAAVGALGATGAERGPRPR
jgi:hypothetical protein